MCNWLYQLRERVATVPRGVGADRTGPVAARVSDKIHEALRGEILEGRLSPGDALPSERVLAERFGVNRHAVREALKRLQQASLVRISHGGPTRVLEWRDSGGLEVLLDLAGDSGDVPPAELMRSVLEMRASIGVDAARRCAARASAEERAAVNALARAVIDAIDAGDGARTDDAYAVLWRAIVVGSGNIAYRLALNSLLTALETYEPVAQALRPTDAEGLRELGESIAAGDVDAADGAARRLLERDVAAAP
jgi:GntR family transcriptional regulator, transcriptional repressor for pyruvate dehydrogenase complex